MVKAGARDEAIMERNSRHKDIHTMRGYFRRAKLVGEKPGRPGRAVAPGAGGAKRLVLEAA